MSPNLPSNSNKGSVDDGYAVGASVVDGCEQEREPVREKTGAKWTMSGELKKKMDIASEKYLTGVGNMNVGNVYM